jgi:hypothetical protein
VKEPIVVELVPSVPANLVKFTLTCFSKVFREEPSESVFEEESAVTAIMATLFSPATNLVVNFSPLSVSSSLPSPLESSNLTFEILTG